MPRRSRSRRRTKAHDPELEQKVLATLACRGELTFAEAAGLETADLQALADHAESLRRGGQLDKAAAAYELLATFDPYEARWWYRTQDLQLRSGNAAAAVMAYQMLEILGEPDAAATSRDRLAKAALNI